jgi:hypothetical protein
MKGVDMSAAWMVNATPKKKRRSGSKKRGPAGRPAAAAAAPKRKRRSASKRRPASLRSMFRGRVGTNPIPRTGGLLKRVLAQATSAGVGALGGIGLDLLMRPVPLTLKTGAMGHAVRAVTAVGVGLLGGGIPLVAQAANGALTITLYNALRQYVAAPLSLGELTDDDMSQLSDAGYQLGVYGTPAELGMRGGMGASTQALGVYETAGMGDTDY